MKKLILFIIFIVCAVGVVLLVYLFAKKSQNPEIPADTVVYQTNTTDMPVVSDGSIVYVDLDSLTANYLMTKDLAAELEGKMSKLDADLTNRQKKFQTSVADFNNKASKGLETRAKLAEIQEQLAYEEQSLMQLAERYRNEMAEEQLVMQRKILQSIMDYLKEYNKEKGYKYILGNAFDAKILYADPSLDITASVLNGINDKYKKQ